MKWGVWYRGRGYQSWHQSTIPLTCSTGACLVPWAWGINRYISFHCPQHAPGHVWYRGREIPIVTSVSGVLNMHQDMVGTVGVGYQSWHQSLLASPCSRTCLVPRAWGIYRYISLYCPNMLRDILGNVGMIYQSSHRSPLPFAPGSVWYRGREVSIVTSVSIVLNMLQDMFGTVGVRYQSSHQFPLLSTCFRICLVPWAWGINRHISLHCPQHAPGYVWYRGREVSIVPSVSTALNMLQDMPGTVGVGYKSSHQSLLASPYSRTCSVPRAWSANRQVPRAWSANRHISLHCHLHAPGHVWYHVRGVSIVTSVSTALNMLQNMIGTTVPIMSLEHIEGVGYQSSGHSPLASTCFRDMFTKFACSVFRW